MPSSTWSERLARAYAVLRGLMVIVFSIFLIILPEKVMPGSASEPARSLALIFTSRTILLGVALGFLAIKGKREALAWLLLADAVLQLFDTGMAVESGKGIVVVLPIALGALDVWAGLSLLRGGQPKTR